jgi:hypothetical protein
MEPVTSGKVCVVVTGQTVVGPLHHDVWIFGYHLQAAVELAGRFEDDGVPVASQMYHKGK